MQTTTAMKMRFTLCLVIFIILFTTLSCKKNANENRPNYYFTVKLTSYSTNPPEDTLISQYDSTIYYIGTLTHESDNTIKIDFSPVIIPQPPHYFMSEGIIYPVIDSSGDLTYPSYTSTYGYFFSGKLKENGDILFEMGANLYGGGFHDSISGHILSN
jgi:hypothetical protein